MPTTLQNSEAPRVALTLLGEVALLRYSGFKPRPAVRDGCPVAEFERTPRLMKILAAFRRNESPAVNPEKFDRCVAQARMILTGARLGYES